ncbi:hypothetical protein IB276_10775 [Ensifer sp. ENS04]|uniref:hypothetical protein n=1 Tax=Ensifer sp. ENS04 TaxID=2769281 RepID=UPI00177FFCA6|nr:hypothetical protein [Ensifer sp. ENS04]MBD9539934.1 hypothetical protein [Ensifer sp. ENS04]
MTMKNQAAIDALTEAAFEFKRTVDERRGVVANLRTQADVQELVANELDEKVKSIEATIEALKAN